MITSEMENVNFVRFYNSLNTITRTYLFLGVHVTTLYRQTSYCGGGEGREE
jgi:hypothetical protein